MHSRPNSAFYRSASAARGFTLLELLISLFILAVVAGAVFEQISQMQKKSSSETMKLDLNLSAREFLDQTVRDLHMSGFPSASMYSNPTDQTKVAAGLVSVSPTQLLFEGDVNNDGNVYSVNIQFFPSDASDPNCPCIRRSVLKKQEVVDPLHPPLAGAYTETQHVVPPGAGSDQSGEDLFAYYDQNGNQIFVDGGSADPGTLATIKTVKINLSLLTSMGDAASGGPVRTSMSAVARLNQ